MQVWVALEQETLLRLSGPRPKRLLAPSLIDFGKKKKDAAFLLTVGSFLLTVELLHLQLTILAFLLTIDNFSFFTYNWRFFAYSFSFFAYSWTFCLQWESASNQGPKGL